MKVSVGRKVAAGFALALQVPLIIGLIAYRNTALLMQNDERVNHSHQVLQSLETLLSQIKDAETGQRGYLITGADRYLEPYRDSLLNINLTFARLRALTADNPEQRRRLDRLKPLIDTKLA